MLLYVHNADEYSVQLKKKADVAKTSGLYEPKSILASVGKLRQSKHVPRSRNRWTSDHVSTSLLTACICATFTLR